MRLYFVAFFTGAKSKQSTSNEPVKRKKDEIEKFWLRGPDLDSYGETVYQQRAHILGDDDLMHYCLDVAAQDALEKGEDACWQLLDHCDCDLVEALRIDCGDDPKAIIQELLHLTPKVEMSFAADTTVPVEKSALNQADLPATEHQALPT